MCLNSNNFPRTRVVNCGDMFCPLPQSCCSQQSCCSPQQSYCPPPFPPTPPFPPVPPVPPTPGLINGIQLQLTGSPLGTVASNAPVLFDAIVSPASNIVYNSGTGQITLTKRGNYYISWWVSAADGAGNPIAFGIQQNGGTPILGITPQPTTVQVNGSALITVSTVPSIVTLTNQTGALVTYDNTVVQANLTIFEI